MNVLITGASKRIGRMISKYLASQGHSIAIHYNSSVDDAKSLLQEIGGSEKNHTSIQANLAKTDEAESLITELKKNWLSPDLIINNASTYFRRGMSEFSVDELMEDYTVNFFSPLIIMKEFKKHCNKGLIINFIDKRVNFVEPEAGPYALAKKSLRDATLACAEEWQADIRVNAIAPGPVLLPGESFEKANKKVLLDKILESIDQLITSEESGSIKIIE